MNNQIIKDKIEIIIKNRLSNVAKSVRRFLPPVLSSNHLSWSIKLTDEFMMVVFLLDQDRTRIIELIAQNYDPFPGLITSDIHVGAAFRFENSRNIIIDSCVVNNSFTFSLGKDSTIVLVNHKQSVNTKELGQYEYNIPLAFLLSYGDEITTSTIYDYFEDLVAYSVNSWRHKNAS